MRVVALDHVQLAMPEGREADARSFYATLLGIPEVAKPVELASRGGCWFESGSLKVHLGVDPNFTPARKAHPGFVVEDLPALLVKLQAADVEVLPGALPDGRAHAYVFDPFGNRIELLAASP